MLTFENKILIKYLRECERFSTRRLLKVFYNKLGKNRKILTLNDFAKVTNNGPTDATDRTSGSGQLFCVILVLPGILVSRHN